MIDITVLGSGSSGNCYKIDDGESSLLIEAGLPIKEIKEGLNFKLSEIEGCLISHEHMDHCKAVEDVMKSGINCYMSKGTAEELNLKHHRVNIIKNKKQYNLGMWTCLAFDVQHDAKEPLGFYLTSKSTRETILYLTDTFYSKYNFKHCRLDYIMVEANYSKEILEENVEEGRVHPAQAKRLYKSHFSLENVKDFLRANDLSSVQEIWLLHLSDVNSDEKLFKREIQELTGKPVYIAAGR